MAKDTRDWPIRVLPLTSSPGDDLSGSTTAAEGSLDLKNLVAFTRRVGR